MLTSARSHSKACNEQQRGVLLGPVIFKILSNSGCFLQITHLRDILCCFLDIPPIETAAALQRVSSRPFELDWFLSCLNLKCTKITVLKPKKEICWIHRPLLAHCRCTASVWVLTSADGYQDIAAGLQNWERTNTFILLVKVLLLSSLAFQFRGSGYVYVLRFGYTTSLKGTWRAYFAFVCILLSWSWHIWARNWSISVLLLFGNFIFQ